MGVAMAKLFVLDASPPPENLIVLVLGCAGANKAV